MTMPFDPATAAVVQFPLHGEWGVTNSPADRVPSHGTDFFAQRYAIDFVRLDPTFTWYYPGAGRALWKHLVAGLPASEFFAWKQPVLAATAGRVIVVADGWPDRTPVRLLGELARATFVPPRVSTGDDIRPLAGNHVMIESAEGIFFYAHLAMGSVGVRVGQQVAAGEILGLVGNSGNSTMPHLHFHLMDGPDPFGARALPFAFASYERWVEEGQAGHWERVDRNVPRALQRVRAIASVS